MSISSASSVSPIYTGDGDTNEYDFGWKITDETHILVLIADADGVEFDALEIDTDYDVDGVGAAGGGSITLVDDNQDWLDDDGNLLADYSLIIMSAVPATQTTSIGNNGAYFASLHEGVFDRLTRLSQQALEQLGRALKFQGTADLSDTGDTYDFDPTLPSDLIGAADTTIITNPTGTGFVAGPTLTDLEDASTAADDAAADAAAAFASETAAGASEAAAAASAAAAAASAVAAAATLTVTTPVIVGSRASPSAVTSAGITATDGVYFQSHYVIGSPGAVDLTSVDPNISAVTLVGARIKLTGCDDTKTVTIFGNDTNKMITNGPRVLKDGSVWEGEWNGTAFQEAFFNNL